MFEPGDRAMVTEWVVVSLLEHQIILNGAPIRAASVQLSTPAGTRIEMSTGNSTAQPFTISSWYRFWRLSQK